MSLTITQRPYQTIDGDESKWNAVANPVLYKAQRKDFTFNQVNSDAGSVQIQFTSVNILSSFSVGDIVYIQSDNGVYDLTAEVTASSFSTHTLVTLDSAYISTAPGGFANNNSLRKSYRLEVEVYDSDNELLTESPLVYSPNSKGALIMDVSNSLRINMSHELDEDLISNPEFIDTNVFKGFYVKYTEVWTDSAESQTNDSDNVFYACLGAMQIPSQYGGNLYEYLLLSDMKKAEVTIPTASILTGNASPVTIVAAPGSGKVILPLIIFTKLDYNSAAYATNTDFRFEINGVAVTGVVSNVLDATADRWSMIVITQIESSSTTLENMPLVFEVQTGNPTLGNSPLYVRCIYTIVDAQ